ncbi:hypothetical protein A6J66_011860 [Yersinia enterocolitica]|nr:hypothetical protein A6J66_011860 [Yersinia enterocolitica]
MAFLPFALRAVAATLKSLLTLFSYNIRLILRMSLPPPGPAQALFKLHSQFVAYHAQVEPAQQTNKKGHPLG